jgi:cell division septation protein DedD
MRIKGRLWTIAAAAAASMLGAASASADVQAGIAAWRAGDYPAAVREWRPLAERGDADAQFNLGQAYRLGRGVPVDLAQAQSWFERAARRGHPQAEANLGLTLFQTGERERAIPWLRRAAERGDPRAQHLLGTAHFNGDIVERDWPRAYALMRRAADQGLPQAASSIAEMERHLSREDRERGIALARQMESSASAGVRTEMPPAVQTTSRPPRVASRPPTVRPTQVPPSRPVQTPVRTPPRTQPQPQPRQPAQTASGAWRVQFGAFGQAGNAQRQWQAIRRVAGVGSLQPQYVRSGPLTKLQAGPLASRAAADRVCSAARSAGHDCIVVAP